MASLVEMSYEHQKSSLHGNGLFAKKGINARETVFLESPLVAMQTLSNRREVMVCAACFGPLCVPASTMMSVLTGTTSPQDICCRSDVCACTKECGEMYCSVGCREKAWESSHRLLCVGEVSEEEAESHPLVQLKILAVTTNEILLLAIQVVAEMVTRHESPGNSTPFSEYAMAPFVSFNNIFIC